MEGVGTPSDDRLVQSVQTAINIIISLRESDGARVTDLAADIGMSKGTVSNHLKTLEANDFVAKNDDGTYHLGLRFLNIAHGAQSRYPVLELVRTQTNDLADESGETALFATEEHGLGVVLDVAYGEYAVKTPLWVGHRDHLHHTAVGKAILAHLPDREVQAIIEEHGLPKKTPNTITDIEELLEELNQIADRGCAYNKQETISGLVGVGAPIQSQDGDVIGGISIIGPSSRIRDQRYHDEFPEMIEKAKNVIELNLTSL
ncbi:DNA-binding transcriptional regulator, IclR family (plasmid) [Halalkaliarchaeum sp. AArc-CO]|uniref:IclR family transcriptional regulator n=1 Tax=Halalkaliarchaeum sp. AArc-CO TaxID=2866381 RepID=UPI00217CD962|nr:IclR family transcriptional regulator [Halalkaliarchaeum sp. AArc-CO]UWG49304.1 DNA-binding transcriptional regulator, IclR family [Halalkaliarchaeum sp. AArc-CO]